MHTPWCAPTGGQCADCFFVVGATGAFKGMRELISGGNVSSVDGMSNSSVTVSPARVIGVPASVTSATSCTGACARRNGSAIVA